MSTTHVLDSTPPSIFLPPLARLRSASASDVSLALRHLRQLYWQKTDSCAPPLPSHFAIPVRHISKAIHDTSVPDSGYASADEDEGEMEDEVLLDEDDDCLEALRADAFERSFAIKWLTGLIARADVWAGDEDERLEAIDDASSILSAFTGTEEETEVAVTRSLTFPSLHGGSTNVELNDAPLSTHDHTSVGLQSWASSIVLAERMCANPAQFGLGASPSRILELGAGTGLLSIVAAKLSPSSDIVATDFHPDVLANCIANVHTNAEGSAAVAVRKLDWQFPEYDDALATPFDIVLAADVIYHPEHARCIKRCVERTLRPGGVFWLMIPVRATGRHEGMYHTVEEVFTGTHGLIIREHEQVTRRNGVGRADEVGYRLYRIGWADT